MGYLPVELGLVQTDRNRVVRILNPNHQAQESYVLLCHHNLCKKLKGEEENLAIDEDLSLNIIIFREMEKLVSLWFRIPLTLIQCPEKSLIQ
jgi:hypothetical protein